ncbi:MAG: M15 family metallopeptidase [Rubrivivax sp.]
MKTPRTGPRLTRLAPRAAWAAVLLAGAATATEPGWPSGFVDAGRVVPGLRVDARYAGGDNFIGRPIAGYEAARCVLTEKAATALAAVQKELSRFGLGLMAFDCYRPQRAVDDFVRWAQDAADQARKADFYPRVDKGDLFKLGYIAARSGHSRGSTLDVTLVSLDTGRELDMGGRFDFFDESAEGTAPGLAPQQRANRQLLQLAMRAHGFRPYRYEWWHFTLVDEPHPETYFDFVVR